MLRAFSQRVFTPERPQPHNVENQEDKEDERHKWEGDKAPRNKRRYFARDTWTVGWARKERVPSHLQPVVVERDEGPEYRESDRVPHCTRVAHNRCEAKNDDLRVEKDPLYPAEGARCLP